MKTNVIILAAGKGTRMKSLDQTRSKVSYPILGVPLVRYVLEAVKPLVNGEIYTIVGFGGEVTTTLVENDAKVVWQHEQKGTGHAVMQVAPYLQNEEGITLIVCGDTPLLTTETLRNFVEKHRQNHHDLTVMTAILSQPKGYGRIIRNEAGFVEEIVEQADATEAQRLIKEVNAGVYVFDNKKLFEQLQFLSTDNKQGELYLTDLIKLFKKNHYVVGASILEDENEMLGINDRVQLAEAAKLLRLRINRKWMLAGVTFEDPEHTYIGPFVKLGQDCIIAPGNVIVGQTSIGIANLIGPNNYLENMVIGDHNEITHSHLVDSTLGNDNHVGPFARMRGHCEVHNHTKIGNFVEMKKVVFDDGAKVSHLTYLGDAHVGEKTNIGCGTITANYDGVNKFHTEIGKDVFIGSGATLIAPITVADGAFVAAGSTCNKDVGANDFAIARAYQVNKEGYATRYHKKKENK